MEDEIDLSAYLRVVYKRKWVIIFLAILFMVLAFVYTRSQTKMYKTTATLLITGSGGAGLASVFSAGGILGGEPGAGQAGPIIPILKSKSLARNVARHFSFNELFKMYNLKNASQLTDERKLKMATQAINGSIQALFKDGLINITVDWSDPNLAAQIANVYIDELGVFLNTRSLNMNFQKIDLAEPSSAPYKPQKTKNIFVGGLLGLFSGLFVAFFMEYWQRIGKKF